MTLEEERFHVRETLRGIKSAIETIENAPLEQQGELLQQLSHYVARGMAPPPFKIGAPERSLQ